MSGPTFSGILTGVIVMAIVVSGLLVFISDGTLKYNKSDGNTSGLVTLQSQFNDINQTAYQVKDKIEKVSQSDSSILDKIGYFFQSGYDAVKLLFQSFGTAFKITDVALDEGSPLLGSFGGILKVMLGTLIIVVIFVMIVLRILTKSEQV